ncbi:acylphosphatase [Candidatus Methanodesulfokora washburnensis]|jgi:acylphosphatase|uniref:acylphosphatase n=1 Tax=Candidatus Methanodesulfokora washburnensis TaxID=2478471 RepID=A0A3R9RQ14_9CREN|nr:acylphosphatase [Candidatus Methanodesulfokores washburnensis]RSN75789.1 acylphosphatase [Candidatus Methanodesulfokores washburnensis]
MPRKRIVITGNVHDVGYRPFLLGIAGFLGIERFYADNIVIDGKQAVEILIDSSEDKISAFIDLIERKKPEAAVVESIQVEDYSGNVMEMESYYRYLTALQLEKIVTYGGQMLKKQDLMLEKQDLMLEKQDEMLKKQGEMSGKMDKMLEKQDQMLEKMDKMLEKQDLMLEKQDEFSGKMDKMLEKQDETIKAIREEGRKTRKRISSSTKLISSKLDNITYLLEERFKRLEEEVERIKKALIKAGIDIQ